MRHRVRKNLKFNWKTFQHRDAMLRNLLTSLIEHKSIKTTEKKAKAVVPLFDKMVNTVNSKDEMNAIRQVMRYVYTKDASRILFEDIAPRYKDTKTSWFTRITPIKYRDWDNAKLVLLEII